MLSEDREMLRRVPDNCRQPVISMLLIILAGAARAQPTWTAQDLHGEYYFGDGLSTNCTLTLDTHDHYVFQASGCLGWDGYNVGSYAVENGALVLSPTVLRGE